MASAAASAAARATRWALASNFFWGGLAGLVFTDSVASLVRVEGVSMQPLLNPGGEGGNSSSSIRSSAVAAAPSFAALSAAQAPASTSTSTDAPAATTAASTSTTATSTDVVLVDKFSVQILRNVRRGEVVLLVAPDDPQMLLVKRVIALPGDELRVASECDARAATGLPTSTTTTVVPPGHVWVEGDNRARSVDSASRFGAVPLGLLRGRVAAVVWPPSRFGAAVARREPGRLVRESPEGERALRRRR